MIQIGDATLYQGDVLSVLAMLPEESVHCVVTSPPYWGLRCYGIEATVWDGEPGCAHEWGGVDRAGGGKQDVDGKRWQHTEGGISGHGHASSAFCRRCGAWLGSHGLEPTPELYVQHEVQIFRAVRRVLRKDGTLWLNLGASYAGSGKGPSNSLNKNNPHSHEAALAMRGMNQLEDTPTEWMPVPTGFKPKDMIPIPWMVAMALQADGWYLRSDIIWAKPNPMPESVTDRPTKAHEYLFLLSKSPRYFYDAEAIREEGTTTRPELLAFGERPDVGFPAHSNDRRRSKKPDGWDTGEGEATEIRHGRNRRSVWTVATAPYKEAHFATFPRKLVQPCILAGCPEHACPQCGAPWVREVEKHYRSPLVKGDDVYVPDTWKGDKSRPRGRREDGTFLPRGDDAKVDRTLVSGVRGSVKRFGAGVDVVTTGEHPTCACGLPAIGGTVLDPFGGSGTTAEVALEYGRRAILIELKPEYIELQRRRLAPVAGRPLLNFAEAANGV